MEPALESNVPGTFKLSWRRDLLEEKNGLREGLGVEVILIVSISGPESDNSSKSSRRSSISAGSMSPPFPLKSSIVYKLKMINVKCYKCVCTERFESYV